MDYGAPHEGAWPNVGFPLEILGLLVAAVGTVLLGATLRRFSVAAIGPASVLLGTWVVGHIPSGPGLLFMAGAVVLGSRAQLLTPLQRPIAAASR